VGAEAGAKTGALYTNYYPDPGLNKN
jgi:hypothetical protein